MYGSLLMLSMSDFFLNQKLFELTNSFFNTVSFDLDRKEELVFAEDPDLQ
jgi:hypothetical protein